MKYDKDEKMVGTAKAAKILGLTQQHVTILSQQGKIPCIKILSRWKYSEKHLDAIVEARAANYGFQTPPTKELNGDHHTKDEKENIE